MKINIFKDKALEIELPKFIDSRALICANSGGGKSYAVRKILEESSNKVMSIILDVEGEFRTLREQYDFLLIGSEGDVELNMKSAKLLPKKIMGLEVSTIIDISDLKRNERIKYVKDFLEALMELPRKEGYWKPCIVVLDEAHLLAGQQEKQDSCSSVIDLMTRGRKRGYCGVLCTQRISKLHKDAVAEANNIMIGRTGLDIDMKRASEILGFTNKLDMLSLRDLGEGEFYVFGTAISRHVKKAKVEEVKTTHPRAGMDLRKEIIKPTEKIINILSNLKDLPQEAERKLKEANDYKKEIIELKRDLNKIPKEVIREEKVIEVVDKLKLEQTYQRGAKETEKKYEGIIRSLELNGRQVEKALRKLISDGAKILESKAFSITADKPPIIIPEFSSSKKERKVTSVDRGQGAPNNAPSGVRRSVVAGSNPAPSIYDEEIKLNLCTRKIYSFLFNNSNREFSRVQLATITGYSHRSGGFGDAISRLNILGLIRKNGTLIGAGELKPELATEDMKELSIELWFGRLNKCTRTVLKLLFENPYESYSRQEIAEQTGYSASSGGFGDAISKLNVLGMINKEGTMIKLNPELLEI